MKLSILDQSPISSGKSARDALHASLELAVLADELGYTRYWIAEHHDMDGLACPNPDVMLGLIGSYTKRIRIGAGAVLLPHYKPYHVAETYNLLATLYPDRVDLGIGRAPGGSAEASIALSGNFLENVRRMPDALDDLLHFLHNDFAEDQMFSKIKPTPVPHRSPTVWLLGTSEKSALLASRKGLPYVFGHFMSDADGPAIVKKYKEDGTGAIVTVSVICAETTAEAEQLALSSLLWNIQKGKGEGDGRVPSAGTAKNYAFSVEEQETIRKMRHKMIVGNPQQVRTQLEQLQKKYNADEWMIVTITHSYEARMKSYKLLADAVFDLNK
ncbi:LLM class flavin-dependent oxidoreductase [Virgibacillus siamensis]|uniref:LLM class flavin-dependent oxidoreductase n=1 Tax=Virgibacillus siamensis TaxID=480071 RepID=UPI000985D737|nr:LLM class flavin-dependent oxidoreductase [Virgibacillus siamensis]